MPNEIKRRKRGATPEAQNIRDLLDERGWKVKDLQRETELQPGVIRKALKGQPIERDNLRAIADAFGVPFADVWDRYADSLARPTRDYFMSHSLIQLLYAFLGIPPADRRPLGEDIPLEDMQPFAISGDDLNKLADALHQLPGDMVQAALRIRHPQPLDDHIPEYGTARLTLDLPDDRVLEIVTKGEVKTFLETFFKLLLHYPDQIEAKVMRKNTLEIDFIMSKFDYERLRVVLGTPAFKRLLQIKSFLFLEPERADREEPSRPAPPTHPPKRRKKKTRSS